MSALDPVELSLPVLHNDRARGAARLSERPKAWTRRFSLERPLAGKHFVEIDAQLHRDEVDAVGLFDRVDLDDVGMIQSSDGLRFSLESRTTLFALGELGRKNLQRNRPVELGVLRQIGCLRRLLLVIGTHPLAGKALMSNLMRSEGNER